MYNPALAPASQRAQIHSTGTESGPTKQQQHLELGLSAQQTKEIDEVQIVSGTIAKTLTGDGLGKWFSGEECVGPMIHEYDNRVYWLLLICIDSLHRDNEKLKTNDKQ